MAHVDSEQNMNICLTLKGVSVLLFIYFIIVNGPVMEAEPSPLLKM